jgi:Cell Wall Hydrolase
MPVWRAWLAACALVLALAAPAGGLRAEAYPPRLAWPQADAEAREREVDCLALNIYFEARSESRLGKLAVAAVTLNRVVAPAFPDSVCAVVNQGEERGRHLCQFSWRCDGLTDTPANVAAWLDARSVAQQALGPPRVADPTGGALWYHADHVRPDWAREMRLQARIGHHLFYGDPPPVTAAAAGGAERPPPCARATSCVGIEQRHEARIQLLDARPLSSTRLHPAMTAGTALPPAGIAGRIRLTPFARQAAPTGRHLALANAIDATAGFTLTDLAATLTLTPPARAQ